MKNLNKLAQKLADKYSDGNPNTTMFVVFRASDGHNSMRSVTPNEVVRVVREWLEEDDSP